MYSDTGSPFSIIQLAMCRTSEEIISHIYEIDGTEALGCCLRVRPYSDDGPDLSKCMMQWYRSSADGSKKELISGPLTFCIFFLELCKYFIHIYDYINW